MKVATWNLDQLRFNATRAERQRKHIDVIDADVWVFTEAPRGFAPGRAYERIACSTSASDLPSEGARWVAIWSRIAAAAVELTADRERSAAIRLTDSAVVVVGTVLPWLRDTRQYPLSGSAAFQARLSDQATDWKRLQKESGERLCVAGDFNQDLRPARHYYGSFDGKRALRAALDSCGLRCLTGGEDDPLKDVPNRASIDHICIGNGLQVKTSPAVWLEPTGSTEKSSDHYGVWANLELV